LVNNAGTEKCTYGPEIIHEKALEFLEKNKDNSFFLYYPSLIPHAELAAPERFMSMFTNRFGPETHYNGIDQGEGYKNGGYGSQARPHAAFAAMIALLDEQVGQLRRKIEELNLAGNTLILFTSDNGPHLEGGADPDYFDSNGLLRGYKRDLYEGGIRVPMIACWPGSVKPNSISNHISAFWDVAPTLYELAGTEVPEGLDGISFLPELLGRPQKPHECLYWEFHEQGGKQAVRLGKWKGVRLLADNGTSRPLELYNLQEDGQELINVASKHPVIIKRIQGIMEAEHRVSEEFPFLYETTAP
jgi:arylsulfatase A-like enzyme